VLKVVFVQVGTLLENDHAEACDRKLTRQYAARCTGTDDNEIQIVTRTELAHSLRCASAHGFDPLRAAAFSARYSAS
jgi:hypothetical protein